MKIDFRYLGSSLILLVAALFIPHTSLAHNKVGNGGGGVLLAPDHYATFSSVAYLSAEYQPSFVMKDQLENCTSEIFDSIRRDIDSMYGFLPAKYLSLLRTNLCNKSSGRYLVLNAFNANNAYFKTQALKHKRLYSQLTRYDKDQIAVFAFTDPDKKKTFLYPEFLKLSYFDQKIILFHELFWLAKFSLERYENKNALELKAYEKMLALEDATYRYLKQPNELIHRRELKEALDRFMNFK